MAFLFALIILLLLGPEGIFSLAVALSGVFILVSAIILFILFAPLWIPIAIVGWAIRKVRQ